MKYSLDKYKYFTYYDKNGKKTVSAVSTYAGKTVKGYAKCDPRDNFSEDSGKKLAAALCNAKVADKRVKRAEKKMGDALRQLDAAEAYYKRMRTYFNDASRDAEFAKNEVICLEQEM